MSGSEMLLSGVRGETITAGEQPPTNPQSRDLIQKQMVTEIVRKF
jgi:hypothetical protein